MFANNQFSNEFFSLGNKTLGVFVFGGALLLLSILIFFFPALIAYFIAGVLLLTAISVLMVAWKLWRLRKQFSDFEDFSVHNREDYRIHRIDFRWRA